MRSLEYLMRVTDLARRYLPTWIYRELHYAARAYAGGKLRGKKRRMSKKEIEELIQKPYASISELPAQTRKLSSEKKRQWMHVFNSVLRQTGSEERALRAAWSAVNKDGGIIGEFRVVKSDEEKRLLYGVVYAPNEVDSQDDWTDAEEIEKAAHEFLMLYGQGKAFIDEGHSNERAEAEPVESFIAPTDFTYDGAVESVKKGSWVLVTHFLTKRAWERAKKEYSGYSMAGRGKREQ